MREGGFDFAIVVIIEGLDAAVTVIDHAIL